MREMQWQELSIPSIPPTREMELEGTVTSSLETEDSTEINAPTINHSGRALPLAHTWEDLQ